MLSNLGTILYDQAKDEEAKPYLERALRIREKTLGPEHPKLSVTLSALGNVLEEQGEYEQALAAHPLVDLAKLAMKDGEFADARTHAERAVSISEAAGNDPLLLAEARFVLARASWPVRSERERARTLALEARAALVEHRDGGDEEYAEVLVEVERWLRRHRSR